MRYLANFRVAPLFGVAFSLLLLTGCALSMRDQPRYDAFEPSAFFADGSSARVPVRNTVARGQPLDAHLTSGRVAGDFADSFPFTVTLETLERGQERYDIFCSPCHGLVGDGNGLIVEYGMRQPTSFHDPDLRDEPPGYYFALITGGTRIMPSYAARIAPADRWAIVAYIRALQLSQNADPAHVPADILPTLQQSETITN
jgi:mono/diheme cytochrome c family protein